MGLDLSQQLVQHVYISRPIGLWQHDRVEIFSSTLYDLYQIAIKPLSINPIYSNTGDLSCPVKLIQCLHDGRSRLDLLVGRNTIFQIKKYVIGIALASAFKHAKVGSRTSKLHTTKFHERYVLHS